MALDIPDNIVEIVKPPVRLVPNHECTFTCFVCRSMLSYVQLYWEWGKNYEDVWMEFTNKIDDSEVAHSKRRQVLEIICAKCGNSIDKIILEEINPNEKRRKSIKVHRRTRK